MTLPFCTERLNTPATVITWITGGLPLSASLEEMVAHGLIQGKDPDATFTVLNAHRFCTIVESNIGMLSHSESGTMSICCVVGIVVSIFYTSFTLIIPRSCLSYKAETSPEVRQLFLPPPDSRTNSSAVKISQSHMGLK